MQNRAAYTDPTITLPFNQPIPAPVSRTESIELISTQQLTPVYNPINLDRSAAVQTPPIPHRSSHWPLGRNVYANNGGVR